MTFHEEWFGPASCEALTALYGKVADLDGDIIEVGCWEGRSTCTLANACAPETVWAVDTWKGSPGEVSAALAENRNVYAQFEANVEALTAGNVTAYIGTWRSFFAGSSRRVKFIHIDATHSYLEVRDNIEAVLPLMVPGGIICGDDVHHPPVRRAVLDTLPGAQAFATLWWAQT